MFEEAGSTAGNASLSPATSLSVMFPHVYSTCCTHGTAAALFETLMRMSLAMRAAFCCASPALTDQPRLLLVQVRMRRVRVGQPVRAVLGQAPGG